MPCNDCEKSKTLQELRQQIKELKQRNLELDKKINEAMRLKEKLFSQDTILKD